MGQGRGPCLRPGRISAVARATGVSRAMVSRAVKELDQPVEASPVGRVHRPGAGRKPITETDPGAPEALEAPVNPVIRGDPMSPLGWMSKSTRTLTDQGHPVSSWTIAQLLHTQGCSLQARSHLHSALHLGHQHASISTAIRSPLPHEPGGCLHGHRRSGGLGR